MSIEEFESALRSNIGHEIAQLRLEKVYTATDSWNRALPHEQFLRYLSYTESANTKLRRIVNLTGIETLAREEELRLYLQKTSVKQTWRILHFDYKSIRR